MLLRQETKKRDEIVFDKELESTEGAKKTYTYFKKGGRLLGVLIKAAVIAVLSGSRHPACNRCIRDLAEIGAAASCPGGREDTGKISPGVGGLWIVLSSGQVTLDLTWTGLEGSAHTFTKPFTPKGPASCVQAVTAHGMWGRGYGRTWESDVPLSHRSWTEMSPEDNWTKSRRLVAHSPG